MLSNIFHFIWSPLKGCILYLLYLPQMWSGFLLLAYELPRYDFSRFDWLNDFGKAEIYFFSGNFLSHKRCMIVCSFENLYVILLGKAAAIISFEEVYMRIFRVLNGAVGCYLISKV